MLVEAVAPSASYPDGELFQVEVLSQVPGPVFWIDMSEHSTLDAARRAISGRLFQGRKVRIRRFAVAEVIEVEP